MAPTSGPEADRIRRLGSDPQYAPLIMDFVAHPSDQVSPTELGWLNPTLSTATIEAHLETLLDGGVLARTAVESSDPEAPAAYYWLTDEARAVFDRHNMFAPEPLRELFERLDHSDEFRELAARPRPEAD
jgi:hypothetical protein